MNRKPEYNVRQLWRRFLESALAADEIQLPPESILDQVVAETEFRPLEKRPIDPRKP